MRTGRKYLMQKANINSLNFFFFFLSGRAGANQIILTEIKKKQEIEIWRIPII